MNNEENKIIENNDSETNSVNTSQNNKKNIIQKLYDKYGKKKCLIVSCVVFALIMAPVCYIVYDVVSTKTYKSAPNDKYNEDDIDDTTSEPSKEIDQDLIDEIEIVDDKEKKSQYTIKISDDEKTFYAYKDNKLVSNISVGGDWIDPMKIDVGEYEQFVWHLSDNSVNPYIIAYYQCAADCYDILYGVYTLDGKNCIRVSINI